MSAHVQPGGSDDESRHTRVEGTGHGRYQWRNLFSHAPVSWPGNSRIALLTVVSLEWFRFDQDALAPGPGPGPMGHPMVEYPDFWGYTRLDYGNRAGAARVMRALEERGIRVTVAVNSDVAVRYPGLMEDVSRAGWEVIGHGTTSSSVLHEGIPEDEERALIHESLETLRAATGGPVRGWLSPSVSESKRTPDLLADEGIEYLMDWVSDDLPFGFHAQPRPLHVVPYTQELNDLHVIGERSQTAWEFCDQIVEHHRVLDREARVAGGRCMCIAIHPWLIGAPHRIGHLERALDAICANGSVWSATAAEVLDAYVTRAQGEGGSASGGSASS